MKRVFLTVALAYGLARGGQFGITVGAGSGAGSSGCSETAGYSSVTGGSYSTAPGFDNPDWSTCSLGNGGPSVTAPGSLSALAQTSQSGGGLGQSASSSASGAANLATGVMNLFASYDAPTTLIQMGGNSSASLWDTITVLGLGSTPTPVTVTLSMNGIISGNPNADNAVMSLFVTQGPSTGNGSGSGAGQCEWAIGSPTESSAYGCFSTGFVTYTLTDGSTYGSSGGNVLVSISATMDLTSSNNVFGVFTAWSETANVFDCVGTENAGCGTVNTMNFLNTGAFSLTLPNGATDTSASGVFLTQQGSDTPEPSTWAICGLGLMLAGISRARARGRATSASAWGRLADR